MRNIFDQYQQPENRLTHALVVALQNDRRLLKKFLRKYNTQFFNYKKLSIIEQQIPGEPPLDEEKAISEGIPDAWIFDDSRNALLIECKIASSVSIKQLKRHIATAKRRGFETVELLVISVVSVRP